MFIYIYYRHIQILENLIHLYTKKQKFKNNNIYVYMKSLTYIYIYITYSYTYVHIYTKISSLLMSLINL